MKVRNAIRKLSLSSGMLHVLIWMVILLLPYFISTAENKYKIGSIPGLFFTESGFIHLAIFYFNALYLSPKLLNHRYWWLYIPSVLIILVASFKLKYFILSHWFVDSINDPTVNRFIFAPSIVALILSIIYSRIIDSVRADKMKKQAAAEQLHFELKFLRSQINPHFLFNVLTNLVSLARKKSEKLEESLVLLSNLMRYMLYEVQEQKVSLKKEIEYLKSYIALQELRFGNDIKIVFHLESESKAENFFIEPMLLIPFVENAFKHGIMFDQQGEINIYLKTLESILIYEVWNKFDQAQEASKDEHSGIGLENIRSRLNLLYKDEHRLEITEKEGWFRIQLTLKLS